MSPRKEEKSDGVCLWCGKPTVGDTIREHIFPKAIGGGKTLPVGSVCGGCNHKFGEGKYGAGKKKYSLDEALKKEHPAMMRSYQLDPRLGRHEKDRKKKEKTEIKGVGESRDARIKQQNSDEYQINTNWAITSETFVRALHKCTANVLCGIYGSVTTRNNYGDLLKFVDEGGDVRPWTYAVSFSKPNSGLRKYEPTPLVFFPAIGGNKHLVSFAHTSGIWITGSQPYLLNPALVESVSETIIKKIRNSNKTNPEKAVDSFGFDGWGLKGKAIGRLRFHWVFKEIEGTPDDRFLYLLTKCKLCGQTNPTGITLPRDIIYTGNLNNTIHYERNTWNRYTLEDLTKSGLKVEKWDKNSLEKYMVQGISIPIENDVRKLEIHECKTSCINCGYVINYGASACFI